MSTRILPAASLSSARRLPAARTLFRASNYLICITLWSIGRAIFRGAANFLPVLRERRVPALPRRVVRGAGFDPTFAGRGLLVKTKKSTSEMLGLTRLLGGCALPPDSSGGGNVHVGNRNSLYTNGRGGMADAPRPCRLLPPCRSVRMVGSDQHTHHGARAGAPRPFPDQSLRSPVRRGHCVVAGQDRCRRQQGRAFGVRGQQRRLCAPQHCAHGPAGSGFLYLPPPPRPPAPTAAK